MSRRFGLMINAEKTKTMVIERPESPTQHRGKAIKRNNPSIHGVAEHDLFHRLNVTMGYSLNAFKMRLDWKGRGGGVTSNFALPSFSDPALAPSLPQSHDCRLITLF